MEERLQPLILHKSLTQPDLLAGGHRVGMVMIVVAGLILIFGTFFHLYGVITGIVVMAGGTWLLRNRAARDPQWWGIYFRHLLYQASYAAHSRVSARRKMTRKPSIP